MTSRALGWREWALVYAASAAALLALSPASLSTPYWWDAAAVYVPGARWVAENDFLAVPGVFPSLLGRGHTTLFYVVTAIAFRLTGTTDPVVGHLVVLGFAALGVACTYALGAWLFGRAAGAAAAVLLAVAPLWLTMSSEALPEVPLAALTVASLYAFARGRHGAAAAWGVAVVLTKETGLACPLALIGALALWGFRARDLALVRRPLMLATVPAVVLAAFFVWQRAAEGWWVLPFHAELFSEERSYLAHGLGVLHTMVSADGRYVALGAAVIVGLWRSRVEAGLAKEETAPGAPPRWVVLAALALVFLAYQVFFTKMWFLERYALAAHPAVVILLAGALVPGDVGAALGEARTRGLAALGLVAVAATATLAIAGRYAGEGYASGETTFRYLHAIEAHLEIYRDLEARPEPARVLTTWPMTEELRDPDLGWVSRRYRVYGSGYFDALRESEAPEIDAIVTAVDLREHEPLAREAARLGMRRTRRAVVHGAVVELYER